MTAASELIAGVRIGDVLAGKYRVERVIGRGGMGVVVAARHLQLDERVAIKFLLPSALANEEAVARFDREARAAVKIKSEHVARVIDVGRLETGAPYMVMEHLDGGDLDAWVRERGPMPVEQAVEFVIQACEAIAEAHALGIVHRDLKPANLFCVRRADGLLAIKVLDFGISKMDAGGAGRQTSTGAIFGTPAYMSPEQMRSSRSVDARADVWSLGVILFELVSGRVPFEGDGFAAMVLLAATGDPLPLRALRPEVPEGFERVVNRCLMKAPEQRFADVADLAFALAPHAPARAKPGIERIQRTLHAARGSHASLRAEATASAPTLPHGDAGAAPGPVLGAAPVSAAVDPRSPLAQPVAGTSIPWGNPSAAERSRRNFVVGFVAAVVMAIAGAGLFVSRLSSSSGAAAAPPAPASTGENASATTSPPPVTPPVTPSVTLSTATAEAPSPPASAAPATPAATPAGAHVPTVPPGPGRAKPSCNPPFTIDASGTKIFKKECL